MSGFSAGFTAILRRLLADSGARLRPDATNGQAREPVAVFRLLLAEHGGKLFQIVSTLGRDLFAYAPDFFKYFVFHWLFQFYHEFIGRA